MLKEKSIKNKTGYLSVQSLFGAKQFQIHVVLATDSVSISM